MKRKVTLSLLGSRTHKDIGYLHLEDSGQEIVAELDLPGMIVLRDGLVHMIDEAKSQAMERAS